MTLYEIDNQILQIENNAIDEETGEIDIALYKDLDALKMAKELKVENIALLVKNLLSDSEQIKEESKKLTERAKQKERKAEWLKQYLQQSLMGEKFESSKVSIGYRKSESVECTLEDISNLPDQFVRFKEPELNKAEVKKALKAGEKVEGCFLAENVSLQIR